MKQDYDSEVKQFLEQWQRDPSPLMQLIKEAVSGLILPFVYKNLREKLFNEKPVPLHSETILYREKFLKGAVHAAWYFCWSVKWFLFKSIMIKGKETAFSSFFLNSGQASRLVKLFPVERRLCFINFGIMHRLCLLMHPRFFCYPYAVFRKKVKIVNYKPLQKAFETMFCSRYNIYFEYREYLQRFLEGMAEIYEAFSELVIKEHKRRKCICLLQDCDYLSERVLLANICRKAGIPSIAVDHSVILNSPFYSSSNSDYALVWGRHQQKRLAAGTVKSQTIIIIGGRL